MSRSLIGLITLTANSSQNTMYEGQNEITIVNYKQAHWRWLSQLTPKCLTDILNKNYQRLIAQNNNFNSV